MLQLKSGVVPVYLCDCDAAACTVGDLHLLTNSSSWDKDDLGIDLCPCIHSAAAAVLARSAGRCPCSAAWAGGWARPCATAAN